MKKKVSKMSISKKNLVSLIKQNLNEMAMKFDGPDRPHQDVQTKLTQNDTPISKVPLPRTGEEPNHNFQELLASERYKQIVEKLNYYIGGKLPQIQNNIPNITQGLLAVHNYIIQLESNHKESLEQLAVELIKNEMGISDGDVVFNVTLNPQEEIKTQDFNRDKEDEINQEEVEIEQELYDDLANLNLEKAKRRLMNAMMQGAAKRGHYMFSLVQDKLKEITGNDNIVDLYGIMMAANDSMYWSQSDDMLDMAMGKGGGDDESMAAGTEKVDITTDPPTITVVGVNFPVLIHELIKAVMELMGVHGQPEDIDTHTKVKESEDTLEKEIWDVRLGPAIWDRIRSQFPEQIIVDENKRKLQFYLLSTIFQKPAREFLVLMKEVISGSDNGKRLLNDLTDGIEKMLNNDDYQDAMDKFDDELSGMSLDSDEDDMDDFLNSMGIHRSDDDE